MSDQLPLDVTPEPVRVPVSDDPRITREERPRLHRQALLILGRLQEGPATGIELAEVGHAQRFGARLYELRKAGHDIRIVERDHATGRVVYQLFVKGGAR